MWKAGLQEFLMAFETLRNFRPVMIKNPAGAFSSIQTESNGKANFYFRNSDKFLLGSD